MATDMIALISAGIALLAAGGAWGAVFVNRRNATDTIKTQVNIGARNSRASVVSANRQKWIASIRADVADFIATRQQLLLLAGSGSFQKAGMDALHAEERMLHKHAAMLRARVEMRLNLEKEEDHVSRTPVEVSGS
ncbi:hypothetical protein [Rhizorhapis sp. SPR117]|uniref:hypothetical protein n=1 Tax=Rhizorhapis sp. SPR117 TaxID=2912611 RepID=UPI001F326C45|nr:hypothetical protein [Rhizorhapis sp. SPR117]